MKKILSLLLIGLLLSGCSSEREDYYIFSFDNFTLAPGYDSVYFLRLVFEAELPDSIASNEKLEDRKVYFWGNYLGDVDVVNETKKDLIIDEALVNRFVFYLSNYPSVTYTIDGIELKDSVRENCELFSGEYIERNGYACVFGKPSGKKKSVVVLYGDIFAIDQDKLDHLEIYVE